MSVIKKCGCYIDDQCNCRNEATIDNLRAELKSLHTVGSEQQDAARKEAAALRDWATGVRDDILQPLAVGMEVANLGALADGYGQATVKLLAVPAPDAEPKQKVGACRECVNLTTNALCHDCLMAVAERAYHAGHSDGLHRLRPNPGCVDALLSEGRSK